MTINSKADLNERLANAICPEPPMSERRAIHESGVWTLRYDTRANRVRGWEPVDFCGDPVASKLLRDWMREHGFYVELCNRIDGITWCWIHRDEESESEMDPRQVEATCEKSECAAVAVEAAVVLGLELEFSEGWDQR